jgi:transposase
MDTSDEAPATDTLGRRVPPRRYRTAAEKRLIVEETLIRGASVALVARKHEVNANLVFGWRKLYEKGLLGAEPTIPATPLLPVRVTDEEPARRRRSLSGRLRRSTGRTRRMPDQSSVEIELAGGGRVRVSGEAVTEVLKQLIDALCQR